jgi:hypothetical protein
MITELKTQHAMKIDPIICGNCSGVLDDATRIKYDAFVGINFKCSFCGCVNRIGELKSEKELSPAHLDDIKSKIERIEVADESFQEIFDTNIQRGGIKLTVWNDDRLKWDYVKSIDRPIAIISFDRLGPFFRHHFEMIGTNDAEIFMMDSKDDEKTLLGLASLISRKRKPNSTIVIDEWNQMLKIINGHVIKNLNNGSEIDRMRKLSPWDWKQRNEIVETILHTLSQVTMNGINIEMLCNYRDQFSFVNGHVTKNDKGIDSFTMPHLLGHFVDQFEISPATYHRMTGYQE